MSEPKIRLTQISPSATGTDSISGNVTITNDLTVGGNLTVSGDTTTLNVQTLLVEDNEIILNSNVTGSPSLNASVTVNRGSSSNAFLLWNEGTDKWGWSDDGNTVTEFATAVLKTGDTMTGQLNISSGGLLVTGNVGIGIASPTQKLTVNGAIESLVDQYGGPDEGGQLILRAPSGGNTRWAVDNYQNKFRILREDDSDSANGVAALHVLSNGNVGIGTDNPNSKLQVYGNTQIYAGNTGNSPPLIFGHETGDPKKAIFLENFWMVYQGHDNEGHKFRSVNASGVATDDVTITGSGSVCIGGTSPNYQLHVTTNIAVGSTGFNQQLLLSNNSIQSQLLGTGYTALNLNALGGNVGIGTTSPISKLHLNGGKFIFTSDDTSYGQFQINAPSGGEATILLGSTGSGQNSGGYTNAGVIGIGAYGNARDTLVMGTGYGGGTFFLKSDKVGIGVTSPNYRLTVAYSAGNPNIAPVEFNGPGNAAWGIGLVIRTTGGSDGASILFRNRDAKNWQIRGETSGTGFGIYEDGGDANYGSGFGTPRLTVAAGGAVSVPGSLSKGSGSFKIDHPLPEKSNTHHLVHSFIEGPQADLIYSGRVQLENGLATVNIDTHSNMTEGTFVALCRDIRCFTTNESDWDAIRGSVSGNILTIECQDPSSNAMVSWMVIGERQDQHMYDTGWTDENGKVIVEPEKETLNT